MNSLETKSRDQTPVLQQQPGVEVLLMYEDFSTGLRGRRLLDEVVNSLDLEVDFHASLWRFDLLREPALLQRATDEAARADVVLLSAHSQNELPAAVGLWLKQWLARKGSEPRALAVALDPAAEDAPVPNRVQEELRSLAGPAGVDLFVQPPVAPHAEWESAFRDIRHRAETETGLLEEMLHRVELPSYRDWGINE